MTTATGHDRGKLKSLVHYICDRTRDPSLLGSTKLNKIVWYTDLLSYVEHGKSITGATYIRKPYGPVVQHLPAILEDLEAEGALHVRQGDAFHAYKWVFISLKKPAIDNLSADEIRTVEGMRDIMLHEHTARTISEATHDRIWRLASDGEEIPLGTVYVAQRLQPDEADIRWAHEVA